MKLLFLPFVVIAAGFMFFATVSQGQTPTGVLPILNCYHVNESTGWATAQFGYYNPDLASKSILVGFTNFVAPPPAFRNQPVDFLPGRHDFVLVAHEHTEDQKFVDGWFIRWNLDGNVAEANAETDAPDCAGFDYAAGPAGPTGPTGPTGPQGPAGAALGGVQRMTGDSSPLTGPSTTATVDCPAGSLVLGGGARVEGSGVLQSSYPSSDTEWTVVVTGGQASGEGARWYSRSAPASAAGSVTPYAICTPPPPVNP